MSGIQTCATCRHWIDYGEDEFRRWTGASLNGRRECKMVNDSFELIAIGDGGRGANLITKADFGCTLHVPTVDKPELCPFCGQPGCYSPTCYMIQSKR